MNMLLKATILGGLSIPIAACSNIQSNGGFLMLESIKLKEIDDIEYKIIFNRSDSKYGIRYEIKSNINLPKIAESYNNKGGVNVFPCKVKNYEINYASYIMTDMYFNGKPISFVRSRMPIDVVSSEIDAELSRIGYVKYIGYINTEGFFSYDGSEIFEFSSLIKDKIDICINYSASSLNWRPAYESPTIVVSHEEIANIFAKNGSR